MDLLVQGALQTSVGMLKSLPGCPFGKSLVHTQGTSGWLPQSCSGDIEGAACPNVCLVGSSLHQFIELIDVS